LIHQLRGGTGGVRLLGQPTPLANHAFLGRNSPEDRSCLGHDGVHVPGLWACTERGQVRSTIPPILVTNFSVGVPPWSFMPNSTETTVGFQPAMS